MLTHFDAAKLIDRALNDRPYPVAETSGEYNDGYIDGVQRAQHLLTQDGSPQPGGWTDVGKQCAKMDGLTFQRRKAGLFLTRNGKSIGISWADIGTAHRWLKALALLNDHIEEVTE